MRPLDFLVAFVAGIAVGLLLASALDRIERREAEGMPAAWPSL